MCNSREKFASDSVSNFLSIVNAIKSGDLSATISGLITDNPDADAIEHAPNHDIPVKILDVQNSDTFTSQIHQTLEKWKPDLIVLAGFLRMIPGSVVDRYPQQIINIHPSLLSKY